MNVLITGIDGFLGWHLRCCLLGQRSIEVIPCDRQSFADDGLLQPLVDKADAIVHLAGMNRGDAQEIDETNRALASRLVDAIARRARPLHVVYSSTIHEDRDTPYGRSKRAAGETLEGCLRRTGGQFTWIKLPHVYGECARPFYNSVVSTFCYQLANGEEGSIDRDGDLQLLHAQDVAEIILTHIRERSDARIAPRGEHLTVSQLLDRLSRFATLYDSHLIPDLRDPLDLRLFNTYRSYLFPSHYPVVLDRHADERGELYEAVRELNGGQTFLSWTKPGVTRGNHYHRYKVERFQVVWGRARISIRKLFTDKVHDFEVAGDVPCYIEMPTLHTHNIRNVGDDDLLTLFWANQIFDPSAPDTCAEEV